MTVCTCQDKNASISLSPIVRLSSPLPSAK